MVTTAMIVLPARSRAHLAGGARSSRFAGCEAGASDPLVPTTHRDRTRRTVATRPDLLGPRDGPDPCAAACRKVGTRCQPVSLVPDLVRCGTGAWRIGCTHHRNALQLAPTGPCGPVALTTRAGGGRRAAGGGRTVLVNGAVAFSALRRAGSPPRGPRAGLGPRSGPVRGGHPSEGRPRRARRPPPYRSVARAPPPTQR